MGFFGLMLALAASWYLSGLSWTVQLVVYPAFALVGPERWHAYHAAHLARIGPAVGPMWLAQFAGLVLWSLARPAGTSPWLVLSTGAACAAVAITALGAVPAHARFAAGYDAVADARLARAHRARTLVWTIGALATTVAVIAMRRS